MNYLSNYFGTNRTSETVAHDNGNVATPALSALPEERSSTLPVNLSKKDSTADDPPTRPKSQAASSSSVVAPSMESDVTHPTASSSTDFQLNGGRLLERHTPETVRNTRSSGYSVHSSLDLGPQGEGWTVEPESSYSSSSHALQLVAQSFDALNEKRSSINAHRLRLQESRSKIRRTRDLLQERENQLLQRVRELIHGDQLDQQYNLGQQQDELEKARNELRSAERNYDHLEDNLIYEEYELNQLEIQIYQEFLGIPKEAQNHELQTGTQGSSAISPAASVFTVGPLEQSVSINNRIQAYIEERDVVRDHIANLNREYQDVLRERESRAEVGLALSKDLTRFLDGATQRTWNLKSRLTLIENELNVLRRIEEDHRLGLSGMDQFKDQPESRTSSDSNRSSHLSESVEEPSDPIFLGNKDRSSLTSMVEQDRTSPIISTLSYINAWLLFALRRSLSQVRLFKSTLALQDLNLDQKSLENRVLQTWPYDQTSDWFSQAHDQAASFDSSSWTNIVRTRHTRAVTESFISYNRQYLRSVPDPVHLRRSLSERDIR